MKSFLVTLSVAILIDRSWSQTCRKEKVDWSGDGIEIHDCDSASYKKLLESFNLEKVVWIYAGDRGNVFPVIDDTFFNKNRNLTVLWLHNCGIETIKENAFSNLKVLSLLALSENKIKKLPENTFRELPNLIKLYLGKNQIETIPEKLFEGNGKLEKLWMHEN
jgi:Leucine-rich repeat (LRR) protein